MHIGKYACQHDTRAANAFFLRKLAIKVSQSLVQSIKIAYLDCLKQKRRDDSFDEEVAYLPPNKHGRSFLLGEQINEHLQLYLKKVRDRARRSNHSISSSGCCMRHFDVQ